MWKSVVGHNVSLKVAEGDDWETDPDFEVSCWDGGSEGPHGASVFTKALSNSYFLPVEFMFCLCLVRNRLSPVFNDTLVFRLQLGDEKDLGSVFQNDVSEQEQRWGAKTIEGSGRKEHIR